MVISGLVSYGIEHDEWRGLMEAKEYECQEDFGQEKCRSNEPAEEKVGK